MSQHPWVTQAKRPLAPDHMFMSARNAADASGRSQGPAARKKPLSKSRSPLLPSHPDLHPRHALRNRRLICHHNLDYALVCPGHIPSAVSRSMLHLHLPARSSSLDSNLLHGPHPH
eukprot:scaffold8455_cov104-Isochrysis_galbana.AAC.10